MTREKLSRSLEAAAGRPLAPSVCEALYLHYRELLRWNRSLALIGRGTEDEIPDRHFGEALAALPLLRDGWKVGVDVGSGAGFPGLVLAAAVPSLRMTLVEARERKWAFLKGVCRKAALPCHCLNARVGVPLPPGIPPRIDLVTARAVKLPADVLHAFSERLRPGGRFLLWVGRDGPELPPSLVAGEEHPLSGGDRRRILELILHGEATP